MGTFGKAPADLDAQREVARELYRYQNFRSSVIAQKVTSPVYQGSSIVAFYSIMRKYLNTGKKDLQRATQAFYDEIERLKAIHYSILRPSIEEQARPYKEHAPRGSRKKNLRKKVEEARVVSKPISDGAIKLSEKARTERAKLENTFLALKLEDKYRTFENEWEIKGYLKCCEDYQIPTEEFQRVKMCVEKI